MQNREVILFFFLFHAGPGTASDHQDRFPCFDHIEDRWQPCHGCSPEPGPHRPHHPHPDSRPSSTSKSHLPLCLLPPFWEVLGLRDLSKT